MKQLGTVAAAATVVAVAVVNGLPAHQDGVPESAKATTATTAVQAETPVVDRPLARGNGRDRQVERKIDRLIRRMTVEEKLQQVQLLSDGQVTDEDARAGVGGVFSLVDPAKIDHLQHIAVEESRLGIPILFAYDTIHGYRTIFPIPLGTASSFDPSVASDDHRIGALESAAAQYRPSTPDDDLA